MSIIPPLGNYNPGYDPLPNIQPFTIRDGVAHAEKIALIHNELNDVIDFVNANLTGLSGEITEAIQGKIDEINAKIVEINELIAEQNETFDSNLAANNAEIDQKIVDLTNFVNSSIQGIIDNSIEIAESVIEGVVDNEASATVVTLKTYFAGKAYESLIDAGRLSAASLNAAYANKATQNAVESGYLTSTSLAATYATKSTQTVVESGRLTQASLDARYTRVPAAPVAVFIGSSNAAPGKWTETFCTRNGLIHKNFCISTGGFTTPVETRFDTQAASAIADISYDHDAVKYVFVCDAGNDIRALATIKTAAAAVFAQLRTAYPKARIIMIPAMWGITSAGITNPTGGNVTTDRMARVTFCTDELREAALPQDVEIVEWSWLWHWNTDSATWMLPNEVHYTAAGYSRIIYFVEKYLRGESTDSPLGRVKLTQAVVTGLSASNLWASREGNLARVNGTITTTGTLAIDQTLFTLPVGMRPYLTEFPIAAQVQSNSRSGAQIIEFYNSGPIRNLSAWPADLYRVEATIPVF